MQDSLFSNTTHTNTTNEKSASQAQIIPLDRGNLHYTPNFLKKETADSLLTQLLNDLPWKQPEIYLYGKPVRIPRMQVWMGDPNIAYTYSNQAFVSTPWHDAILQLKHDINITVSTFTQKEAAFNSVLCNLYRDGNDSVSWHSDNEPELGFSPIVASFSLGATRRFLLKPKKGRDSNKRFQLDLTHNSLLIMGPGIQEHWIHQVPKTQTCQEPRINLTFRHIILSN